MISFNKLFLMMGALSLSVSSLTACTSNSGGGSGTANGTATEDNNLPAIEGFDLSGFEKWRRFSVKACDVQSIFRTGPGFKNEKPLFDLDILALFAASGNRVDFTGSSMLISSIQIPSGYSTSSSTMTSTVDGRETKVQLQAIMSRGVCEVFVNEKSVAKVRLAQRIGIHTYFKKTDQVPDWQRLALPRETLPSGFVRVEGRSFFDAFENATQIDYERLYTTLGMEYIEDAKKIFQHEAVPATSDITVRWVRRGGEALPAFNQNFASFYLPAVKAQTVFGPQANPFALEWVFTSKAQPFFPKAPQGPDVIRTTIAIRETAQADRPEIRVTEVFNPTVGELTVQDVQSCLRDNARLAGAAVPANPTKAATTWQQVAGPCKALGEVDGTKLPPSLVRDMAQSTIAGIEPQVQADFGGWDQILTATLIASLKRGEDAEAELSTQKDVPLLKSLLAELRRMHTLVSADKRLQAHENAYYGLAKSWAMRALHPADNEVSRITSATAPLIAAMPDSVERLFRILERDANGDPRTLQFAESLDERYIRTALAAHAAMTAAGNRDWLSLVYANILQHQIPQIDLENIAEAVPKAQALIQRHPGLRSQESALVSLIIANPGNRNAQRIEKLAEALAKLGDQFPTSTSKLLQDARTDLAAQEGTIAYILSLTPELISAAKDAALNAEGLEIRDAELMFGNEILQRRPDAAAILQGSKTLSSLTAFARKELMNAVSGIRRDLEYNAVRKVVSHAWTERWNDAELVKLEAFADLITTVYRQCKDSRAISARISCTGLDRFSTASGRLLDPAYGNRYVTLAQELNKLGQRHASSMANSLLISQFADSLFSRTKPTWASCSATDFDGKLREMTKQAARLGGGLVVDNEAEQALRKNQKDCAN